jgi:ComEC/Rec2-related protein
MITKVLNKITKTVVDLFPATACWIRFPSFIAFAGFSTGIAITFFLQKQHDFAIKLYNEPFAFAIIFVLLLVLLAGNWLLKFGAGVLLGVMLLSCSTIQCKTEFQKVKNLNAPYTITGKLISPPSLTTGRYSFIVLLDSMLSASKPSCLHKKYLQCYSEFSIVPNARIKAYGKYTPPMPRQNPLGFDDYTFKMSNRIWGAFTIDSVVAVQQATTIFDKTSDYARSIVTKAVSSIKNPDNRSIILASFLNDRSDMSADIKNVFYKAGIYHLLALSGFNIAILASVLFLLLMFVPIAREIKISIVLFAIWSYLFFIGPIPSLFRAVIMTTIILAAYLFQRKPYALNTLGLAGIIWLTLSPLSLFTPGFQLSFSATAGLLLLNPVIEKRMLPQKQVTGNLYKWFLKPLLQSLSLSISAFLCSAPVLMYHFGTLSVAGLIANLFAIFLMSIAMWICLIGFFFQMILPVLTPLCMLLAESIINGMIFLCSLVANLPFSIIQTPHFPTIVFFIIPTVLILIACIKDDLWLKVTIIATSMGLVACTFFTYMSYDQKEPQVVSFFQKKSPLVGIYWPNGSSWILTQVPKANQSLPTITRQLKPWLWQQSLSKTISNTVLFGNYCNATQLLEPVLEQNKIITVTGCEKPVFACPEFSGFLSGYHTEFQEIPKQMFIVPCMQCTCFFNPRVADKENPSLYALVISMYGNRLQLDNPSMQPEVKTGAITATYHKNLGFDYSNQISPLHPVYAAIK